MGAEAMSRGGSTGAAGRGGRTKSGKLRPGTGGYGKRRLEGKGPTPPAYQRPGHPAQRRAAAAASRDGARGESRDDGQGARRPGNAENRSAGRVSDGGYGPRTFGDRAPGGRPRGAGDAPEVVAGRNSVLESLRARVPATALYAGPRGDPAGGRRRNPDDRGGPAGTRPADRRSGPPGPGAADPPL